MNKIRFNQAASLSRKVGNLIAVALLCLMPLNIGAVDLTAKEFYNLQLIETYNGKRVVDGGFTFPVVLLYGENGKLTKNLWGQQITDSDYYANGHQSVGSLSVESPKIDQLLEKLNYAKKSNKNLALFIALEICPPCQNIEQVFRQKTLSKINSQYEVIFINVLDQ